MRPLNADLLQLSPEHLLLAQALTLLAAALVPLLFTAKTVVQRYADGALTAWHQLKHGVIGACTSAGAPGCFLWLLSLARLAVFAGARGHRTGGCHAHSQICGSNLLLRPAVLSLLKQPHAWPLKSDFTMDMNGFGGLAAGPRKEDKVAVGEIIRAKSRVTFSLLGKVGIPVSAVACSSLMQRLKQMVQG